MSRGIPTAERLAMTTCPLARTRDQREHQPRLPMLDSQASANRTQATRLIARPNRSPPLVLSPATRSRCLRPDIGVRRSEELARASGPRWLPLDPSALVGLCLSGKPQNLRDARR